MCASPDDRGPAAGTAAARTRYTPLRPPAHGPWSGLRRATGAAPVRARPSAGAALTPGRRGRGSARDGAARRSAADAPAEARRAARPGRRRSARLRVTAGATPAGRPARVRPRHAGARTPLACSRRRRRARTGSRHGHRAKARRTAAAPGIQLWHRPCRARARVEVSAGSGRLPANLGKDARSQAWTGAADSTCERLGPSGRGRRLPVRARGRKRRACDHRHRGLSCCQRRGPCRVMAGAVLLPSSCAWLRRDKEEILSSEEIRTAEQPVTAQVIRTGPEIEPVRPSV